MKNIIIFILIIAPLIGFSQVDSMSAKEKDMITQINTLRTNPKSFIPYIEAYIGNQNEILKFIKTCSNTSTKTIDIYNRNINEANKLIVVLKNTKPLSTLTVRMDMFAITKAYAKHLDSLGLIEHKNTQGRFKSLGIFVTENIDEGYDVIGCLVNLMIDNGNQDYTHRKNLLDPTIKSVSVAYEKSVWVQNFSQK